MVKESVKDMTVQELNEKLKDYNEEMRNLRVQAIMGQMENKKRKWFVRKKIAQIKTILHEYKLEIRKLEPAKSKPVENKKDEKRREKQKERRKEK